MKRLEPLDARRIDWLVTARAGARDASIWLLARRGRAGVRARRGAVLPGGRALLGLVRGAGGQPRPRRDQAIVHGAGDRSLLERQRPRSPGDHEDALRPVVAGVPPLHLHGAGARPAPDPGHGPPRHAAAVRARVDRVSLPRDPVRGAAGRRWSTGSRAAGCRGPPAAAAAVLTLAQPHYFFHAQIACFDAPITTMAFAVGFAYWKSLRSPRWGIVGGRAVRHRARASNTTPG